MNDVLENEDERYDVSTKRQSMVLRIICEDIQKVKVLCKEYDRRHADGDEINICC